MNTINKLNEILPDNVEDYTNEHIEEIIKWHRKQQASYVPGKSKKKEATSEDLELAMKLMIKETKPTSTFKRRI